MAYPDAYATPYQFPGISSNFGVSPGAPGSAYSSAPVAPPITPSMPTDLSGIYNFGQPANQELMPVAPVQAPQQQSWLGKTGSWLSNGQNLATVLQGIGALSQAYLGFQQLKLAKESLGLQKQAFKTNLRNSTQTYNTSLEDRIRGRTSNYEGKENDVNSYLDKHSLTTG